jgi:type IV secretory pathway VirB2 component (pilin)
MRRLMENGQAQVGAGSMLWGTIVLSFFHVLPGVLSSLAAVAGIVWSGLMIYESATMQSWLRRRGSSLALPTEKKDG